jgi:hypothetical protein
MGAFCAFFPGDNAAPTAFVVPRRLLTARRQVAPQMQGLECPGQDSNLHAISGTGPSNQPVYQFQHLGNYRD